MVGVLSRSAGSTTAARNRYGSYFRNRVMPTNPATPNQTEIRSNFGSISANWRALTEAQRAAWEAWAPNLTRTDTLGNPYTLNGQTAYISVQRNLYTVGGAATTTPPAYDPPAALSSMTITATSV